MAGDAHISRGGIAQPAHARCRTPLRTHSPLPPLTIGDCVRIQNQTGPNPTKWDKTGVVVEATQFDQYVVRVDGSGRVTLRNRRFLRKYIWHPARQLCRWSHVWPPSTQDQLLLCRQATSHLRPPMPHHLCHLGLYLDQPTLDISPPRMMWSQLSRLHPHLHLLRPSCDHPGTHLAKAHLHVCSAISCHTMLQVWRKWWCFRPLLCTLFRLNWAKQTPGIMRRN